MARLGFRTLLGPRHTHRCNLQCRGCWCIGWGVGVVTAYLKDKVSFRYPPVSCSPPWGWVLERGS